MAGNGSPLSAAVSLGTLAGERDHAAPLQSIADVARAIVGAAASSIFLVDDETGELEFAAVSGAGAGELLGQRLPAGTGIAGWTVASRQAVLVQDVDGDERFSREAAELTGYVPRALMAAPLLYREHVVGVLEVLDWAERPGTELDALDLLALFAHQAAIAVELLRGARAARRALAGEDGQLQVLSRVAAALEALEGERRLGGIRLLSALEEVLVP